MSGTGHLDLNAADRARLLASATAYAAGRRTYVVGAVSDVVAANAGRLDAAAREALADAWHMRDDIIELARRGDVRKSLPDMDFDARLARLEAGA